MMCQGLNYCFSRTTLGLGYGVMESTDAKKKATKNGKKRVENTVGDGRSFWLIGIIWKSKQKRGKHEKSENCYCGANGP